jgi:hypothetical protein
MSALCSLLLKAVTGLVWWHFVKCFNIHKMLTIIIMYEFRWVWQQWQCVCGNVKLLFSICLEWNEDGYEMLPGDAGVRAGICIHEGSFCVLGCDAVYSLVNSSTECKDDMISEPNIMWTGWMIQAVHIHYICITIHTNFPADLRKETATCQNTDPFLVSSNISFFDDLYHISENLFCFFGSLGIRAV